MTSSSSSLLSPVYGLISDLRSMNVRQFIHQLLSLALIVASALMIFKGLVSLSGSESPVVVVVSGSMEPAFYRGDILFLWLGRSEFELGEIVVFKIEGKETPIVHRIIELHSKPGTFAATNGSLNTGPELNILTKGDNNQMDDRHGIYKNGQDWLGRADLMGRVIGYLPYLGYVTISLTDFPAIKYALVALMGLFVLTAKE
jgi:signal peptidase